FRIFVLTSISLAKFLISLIQSSQCFSSLSLLFRILVLLLIRMKLLALEVVFVLFVLFLISFSNFFWADDLLDFFGLVLILVVSLNFSFVLFKYVNLFLFVINFLESSKVFNSFNLILFFKIK